MSHVPRCPAGPSLSSVKADRRPAGVTEVGAARHFPGGITNLLTLLYVAFAINFFLNAIFHLSQHPVFENNETSQLREFYAEMDPIQEGSRFSLPFLSFLIPWLLATSYLGLAGLCIYSVNIY